MKPRLFTPGPTPVPESIILRMAQPIIHHRTPEFQAELASVGEGLRYLFCTEQPVMTLTSSGTGAMEAAGAVWMQRAGIAAAAAERTIARFAVNGRIPEPLRTAHLIAGGLGGGRSRQRV